MNLRARMLYEKIIGQASTKAHYNKDAQWQAVVEGFCDEMAELEARVRTVEESVSEGQKRT